MIEIDCAGVSEQGPRPTNEDRIGAAVPTDPTVRERKGGLFVVADGLGGHRAGEIASETAVRTVIDDYYAPSSHGRVETALQRAVQAANLRIYDLAQRDSELRAMGTTLVALAVTGTQAYVAHVGDSRVYHWRAGQLILLTNDHSEAAELARLGLVRRDRLADHPGRNALTRSLGTDLIVRPDFIRRPIVAGDRFLLCSDGLWSEVGDGEIAEALTHPPERACRLLAQLALANGSADNVTAQVVHVAAASGTPVAPASRARRWPFFARAGDGS